MKALTLTQPWASLVAIGAKTVETRSWSTKYRGPIAIHAAKDYPASARAYTVNEPIVRAQLEAQFSDPGRIPTGAVIAVAELVDVVPTGRIITDLIGPARWMRMRDLILISTAEALVGDFSDGRFGWLFAHVHRFQVPVPTKGMLGLWETRL